MPTRITPLETAIRWFWSAPLPEIEAAYVNMTAIIRTRRGDNVAVGPDDDAPKKRRRKRGLPADHEPTTTS